MFGYSKIANTVFTLRAGDSGDAVTAKVKVETKLVRMDKMQRRQWRQLKQLQGHLNVSYLKFRYGSSQTYILLGYVGGSLVHVEWVVPAYRIRPRYHFVTDGSYAIVSCLTAPRFRGLGIYPSQIQRVVRSDIPANLFWIWTVSDNTSSLKGIRKSGAVEAGEFIQVNRLWGCISDVKYTARGAESR